MDSCGITALPLPGAHPHSVTPRRVLTPHGDPAGAVNSEWVLLPGSASNPHSRGSVSQCWGWDELSCGWAMGEVPPLGRGTAMVGEVTPVASQQ